VVSSILLGGVLGTSSFFIESTIKTVNPTIIAIVKSIGKIRLGVRKEKKPFVKICAIFLYKK